VIFFPGMQQCNKHTILIAAKTKVERLTQKDHHRESVTPCLTEAAPQNKESETNTTKIQCIVATHTFPGARPDMESSRVVQRTPKYPTTHHMSHRGSVHPKAGRTPAVQSSNTHLTDPLRLEAPGDQK
jgi:hypothetical protein